jgi:hypothetical protein
MRSRRAIIRKRLPSSSQQLSSIRRKKKRIALGLSTTYTKIKQEKEEYGKHRLILPDSKASNNAIHDIEPITADGSIILNRLVESPVLSKDILIGSSTMTSEEILSGRGTSSSNNNDNYSSDTDSDGSDDMFPSFSQKKKKKVSKLNHQPENPNIIRIRGRTSWGTRPAPNTNPDDNDCIVVEANGGKIISKLKQQQHSSFSLASLEEENKLVFIPRERNPFIERIEFDQKRIKLLEKKLKSSNEVEPAIQQVGMHVPISGIVNKKSFNQMSQKLSLAPKYIDQLIYGKTGIVDNEGNVNLVKLGVVDANKIKLMNKHANSINKNSKYGDTETVEMYNTSMNNHKSLTNLFHKTGIDCKSMTGSKSLPYLQHKKNKINNRSIVPNHLGNTGSAARAQSPPWKNGKASARWGEEHYRSTDSISGQKGTSFYSPNTFRRDIPLGSEIDRHKKNERMKYKKALYENHNAYINQRKNHDTKMQKHLHDRHMTTVKKQAKRYDKFLAAERIKRATMWTDSGKLIDEDAPLHLNHRKHQYKQHIDDGSYHNAMSRRNGLTRMEWSRVFR